MAVPNIKTINSCAAIKYGSTDIKGVMYSDSSGNLHEVWPATTTLSNPIIVDLTENKDYEYSYDTTTNTPSPCLKPGHHYAVKMTLTRRNANTIAEQYSDCYISHLTFQNSNGWWFNRSNGGFTTDCNPNHTFSYPDKSPRVGDGTGPYIQQSYGYAVFECDCTPETSSIQPQATLYGEFYKDYMEDLFVTTGYFGDKLYATPIILKRAAIYEDPTAFYTDNSYTDSAHRLPSRDGNILHVNESITLYPKVHKSASDPAWTQQGSGNWDKYELQSYSNISYDNSVFTVVENQDGSYTITAIGGAGTDARVTFSSSDYVRFTIVGTEYRVKNGNVVIDSTNGISITSDTQLGIEECVNPLADPQQWNPYTGSNCSITSANDNIIHVSGKTLQIRSFGVSTTVTVTVENQQLLTFPVNVQMPSNIYYRSGTYDWQNDAINWIDGNSTILSNNPTSSWGNVSSNAYAMKFATDSSLTTGFNVYFDSTSIVTTKNANVDLNNTGDGVVLVTFRNLSNQSDSFTLDVYSDYGRTNKIGTITISFYNS